MHNVSNFCQNLLVKQHYSTSLDDVMFFLYMIQYAVACSAVSPNVPLLRLHLTCVNKLIKFGPFARVLLAVHFSTAE